MSRIGRVQVTYALLSEILKFPPGTDVRSVQRGDGYRLFEIVVEHPDLAEVPEGDPIPVVEYVAEVVRAHFA